MLGGEDVLSWLIRKRLNMLQDKMVDSRGTKEYSRGRDTYQVESEKTLTPTLASTFEIAGQ